MTLAEFKAWFEGFTEDLEGAPNEKQFAKIKQRVSEINGTPTNPVVVREYIRPYWDRFHCGPIIGYNAMSTSNSAQGVSKGTIDTVTVDDMKTLGVYDSMMV